MWSKKELIEKQARFWVTSGVRSCRRGDDTHGNLANEIHDLLAGFAFERVPEFERAVDERLELRIGV